MTPDDLTDEQIASRIAELEVKIQSERAALERDRRGRRRWNELLRRLREQGHDRVVFVSSLPPNPERYNIVHLKPKLRKRKVVSVKNPAFVPVEAAQDSAKPAGEGDVQQAEWYDTPEALALFQELPKEAMYLAADGVASLLDWFELRKAESRERAQEVLIQRRAQLEAEAQRQAEAAQAAAQAVQAAATPPPPPEDRGWPVIDPAGRVIGYLPANEEESN